MAAQKMLADVLEEYCAAKKTGALFVSVIETSENLIRFYLKDGAIYGISYGPVKDRECLDILDCYHLGKAVYFDGVKTSQVSPNMPSTAEIIGVIRKGGKQVLVD